MLKISLYPKNCVYLCQHLKRYHYRNDQSYRTDRRTTSTIRGRLSHRQKPRIPYALPRYTIEIQRSDLQEGWRADRNDAHICQLMGETFRDRGNQRSGNTSWAWAQAHHGQFGRGNSPQSHRKRQAECEESERGMAAGFGQGSEREHLQGFFIRLGARYRRIRKRPKGKPSPQLYAYKSEKLQELVKQEQEDLIDLYYGDESHICTEGYVPYGWQFRGEDVYIPSERGLRLNIFGMIDRNNRYEGFSTTENMTADKIADFIDQLSLRIHKNSFVVLDNASVHRCKLMRELRPIWEKRGLFLFFLPPYSPHLNIAETLWRILKGKWLKPVDYISTDSLLYATNRALAALGTELNINFAHVA